VTPHFSDESEVIELTNGDLLWDARRGGALLDASEDSAAQLRINVTSPNGTTQAGLAVLMAELPDLMTRTVAAAAGRSRDLARDS